MTTSIDYILQLGTETRTTLPFVGDFREVMHGTPDLVVAWLKHMPQMAKKLYVKDSEFDLIVTARQYVEKHETGATSYPDDREEPKQLINFSEWV